MLFSALRLNRVYVGQGTIPFPKGAPIGKGEFIFLCEPTYESTVAMISNPKYQFSVSKIDRYTSDVKFRRKIGAKMVLENHSRTAQREFEASTAGKVMRFIPPLRRSAVSNSKYSIAYDFGKWNEIFFTYRKRTGTAEEICNTYVDFLLEYLNQPGFEDYHKLVVMEPSVWLARNPKHAIGVTKGYLNDPVSILYAAAYRFPDVIAKLKGIEFYLVDAVNGDLVYMDTTYMNKKEIRKFRTMLTKMGCMKLAEEEETVSDKEGNISDDNIEKIEKLNAVRDENKRDEVQAMKTVITTPIAKVDEVPKTTVIPPDPKKAEANNPAPEDDQKSVQVEPSTVQAEKPKTKKERENEEAENDLIDLFLDLEDEDKKPVKEEKPKEPDAAEAQADNELDEEIDTEVEAGLDEMDDTDADPDTVSDVITDRIKRNVMIQKFKPDFDPKTTARIQNLMKIQDTIVDQSIDDMKAKIIPPTDLSRTVNSTNQSIIKPKAKNFYKGYNENLFDKDIDRAVATLSKADYPLFIQSKTVEDTSDTMNLKKTYTYEMADKDGHKHTIKFDVPIFIDDRYIYLGGNKKVVENQLFTMPLVKSGPDEVQLVTLYRKIIMYRTGYRVDMRAEVIKKYILSDQGVRSFRVKIGDSQMKNRSMNTTLDYDNLSKNITSCEIGGIRFIFNVELLMKEVNDLLAKDNKKPLDSNYDSNGLLIGYHKKTHELVYASEKRGESVNDRIFDAMSPEQKSELAKFKVSPKRLAFVRAKIYNVYLPIVVFMCFCEGLTSVLQKAKATYEVVEPGTRYNALEQSALKFSDKWVIWDHHPLHISLIFNGLYGFNTEDYTFEEADGKSMWIDFMLQVYKKTNAITVMDQFKNFMIDPITAEVLRDMNLPTDLVSLLIAGCIMMNNSQSQNVSDPSNFRLRSNEIFVQFIYESIADAYLDYRKTVDKKSPKHISVAPNLIMRKIYGGKNPRTGKKDSACSMIEDASVLNPILELEKKGTASFRGPSGINLDAAYTLQKRSYDPGMTGTLAISTSPDKNVGVARQLTLDPNVTSLRGYIGPHDEDAIDDMTGAQLFSPAELLSPPGVMHDDAQRTAMAYKQSKYMVPIEDASPVLMGNKVEAAIPNYMSRDFVVTAKKNGVVEAIENDIVIIKYSDGTYDSFSLEPRQCKNSAGGFYIEIKFETDLQVGDKVIEGQIVAYNPVTFTKNRDDKSASMNIGVLAKIAIAPTFDIYEDSVPITSKLAERLATTVVNESRAILAKEAVVQSMVKIGDHVEVGDPLITYDNSQTDPELSALWEDMEATYGEALSENVINSVKAEKSGVITDIKIYSAVDKDELSPTLRPIVTAYWKKIKKHNDTLEKYRNADDPAMLPCGQQIKEIPGPVEAKFGKILGETVNDGVLICFFIKHKDIVKKGDKLTAYTALKGIVSNVIDPGYEPRSEYRMDEEISCFLAPGAILARKTPSVILTMFTNKIIIELKRHLRDQYLET